MKEKTAKDLLKKVKKDYSSIADEFSNTRNHSWPEFELTKPYLKGKIVDLGCGNGRLYEYLKEKSINKEEKIDYIGIDNNENFLNIAKKKYKNAKFLYGDLLSIPINENSANTIISIAAFHHIPSKVLRKKSVQEIRSKLCSDGIVILTVWNLFQGKYIKYALKSLFKFFIQFGKYDWSDTFIPWSKTKWNS